MAYLSIFGTILFSVYSLLVFKWRIVQYVNSPAEIFAKPIFFLKLFLDPYMLSGCVGVFLSGICWMVAMVRFDLSHAYPFTSLSYILVMLLSGFLLNEPITLPKILGAGLIVAGIIVGSQG